MPTADDLIQELGSELDRVRRYARLVHRNTDDADDAVADGLARMLPRWRAGRIDDPSAYLRRSVANCAAGRWRRRLIGSRKDHAALDWLPRSRDPATDTWRTLAPGPAHPGAQVATSGEQIYAFFKNWVMVYDIATDTWDDAGGSRSDGYTSGPAIWSGDRLVVLGGTTPFAVFGP